MWKRWNKTDRRIMSIAIVLLLLMSYLLYDDALLFPSEDDHDLTAIGKVTTSLRDVRRKSNARFLWRSGKKNDVVHDGDSIFTGEGSAAVVQLDNGRVINLEANSLVVFNYSGDQLNLDLKYGKFSGKIDGCVKVKVAGEMVEVCGTDSKVEIDAKGSIGVDGNAKISRNGQQDTNPAVLPQQIRWKQGPQAKFYHFNHVEKMQFSWESKSTFGRYRVQFSKTAEFTKPAIDEISSGTEFETVNYPVKGKYFVRILAEDAKGRPAAVSPTESTTIIEADKPVISLPLADAKIIIKTDADGLPTEPISTWVQWNYSNPQSAFQAQIASDKDFTKPLTANIAAGKLQWFTAPVEPGLHFVRVKEAGSSGKDTHPWSAPVAFTFELAPAPGLTAPILLTKKIDYEAPQEKKPMLGWKPVDIAKKYLVEFSENQNFNRKDSFWSNTVNFKHDKFNPGKSYFRVFAATDKGKLSPPSETGELNVNLNRPIIDAISDQEITGKSPEDPGSPIDFNLHWTDLKIPDAYQVQVSATTDFTDSESIPIKSTKSSIKVPKPGTYYFRVRGTKDGKPVTPFSEPVSAKYNLNNPLFKPTQIEPVDQMTLFFQKNTSPFVWLEWKPVPKAVSYNVELALDANFEKKVYSFKTNSQRYLIKEKLPQGLIYWRAQAVGDKGQVSEWAAPFSMTVFTGKATDNRMPANKR